MFALLGQRNFLLLWVAHTISILGDYVFFVAITFWIYERTGSAAATGAVLVVSTIPMFLFAPVAGMVVDRWDRRRIMLLAEGARAVLFLGLLVVVIARPSTLWPIYVVAFVQSALGTFFWPARGALLPQMIELSALLTSNALYMLSDSIVRILAPSLSALVLLRLGPPGVIIVDAASFITLAGSVYLLNPAMSQRIKGVSPLGERIVPEEDRVSNADVPTTRGERVGVKRRVGGLLVLGAIVAYTAGTLSILLPVFVHTTLLAGPLAYGWLLTAQAIGEGGMSVLMGQGSIWGGRVRSIGFVSGSLALGGLMLMLIVRIHILLPGLLLNLSFGAMTAATSVQILTWLQKSTDRRFFGRALVAYTGVQALTQVVGMGIASVMTSRVGVGWLIVFDGGSYIVGSGQKCKTMKKTLALA